MKRELTAERLREVLRYNKRTGVFKRLIAAGGLKVGEVAGCTKVDGYVTVRVDGCAYQAHRLAWLYVKGVWPTGVIDHKHGKAAGNGISNLRDGSRSFNAQNQRRAQRNNSSGLLGAYRAGKTWKSWITVRNAPIYLGVFSTAKKAHQAYISAKRELHPGCTL